jgi:hypothetical protein
MPVNPDFRDLLSALNDENAEYLLVGAHAVIFYAEPRYTKDMDILVNPAEENAPRVYRALGAFGAPLDTLTEKDLLDPRTVFQIGIEPNRIDIITGISGVDFSTAWKNKVTSTYGEVPINIIGKNELVMSKRAAGRLQDRLDLEKLGTKPQE